MNNLFEITRIRHRLEQIAKDLKHYEETLQAELLGGSFSYDEKNLYAFNELIDEAEEINQLLEDSAPTNENITMLSRDFKDLVDKI